jgi:electron transfer flavoprotein beta subunit
MSAPISVAVLVSAGRHPVSGAPRACRGDTVAMAVGNALAGDTLRIVHAGEKEDPALKDYMALGASRIEVLEGTSGGVSISALAAALRNSDIILTGSRAEQGAGSGLLPYVLAEALGRPIISNALEVKIEVSAGREATIRQFLPRGQRRQVACPLPVIVAVHPLAPVRLKYAYARRISGRIEPLPSAGLDESVMLQPSWAVEAEPRHPQRLKAQEKKAAHARLLSAIVSEVKGGVVAFEGTSVDKAQVVLNYLREHRLVDF